MYSLCSDYYKSGFWRAAYEESIYPVPREVEWIVPKEVQTMVVLPPNNPNQTGRPKNPKHPGRPKKKRILSVGEFPRKKSKGSFVEKTKKQRKYENCGEYGHYRTSCHK